MAKNRVCMTFTLEPHLLAYLQQFNDMLERKHHMKFGASIIVNTCIGLLQTDTASKVETILLGIRRAREHMKAIREYNSKRNKVEENHKKRMGGTK